MSFGIKTYLLDDRDEVVVGAAVAYTPYCCLYQHVDAPVLFWEDPTGSDTWWSHKQCGRCGSLSGPWHYGGRVVADDEDPEDVLRDLVAELTAEVEAERAEVIERLRLSALEAMDEVRRAIDRGDDLDDLAVPVDRWEALDYERSGGVAVEDGVVRGAVAVDDAGFWVEIGAEGRVQNVAEFDLVDGRDRC